MTTEFTTGTLKTNDSRIREINIRHRPDRRDGRLVTRRNTGTKDDTDDGFGWVREDVIELDTRQEPPTATDANTQLIFETDQEGIKIIRVFQGNGQLYINVHDKKLQENLLREEKAIYLPDVINVTEGAEVPWQSYIAEKDGKVYIARFIPRQKTELIISYAVSGEIISSESGVKSDGTAYRRLA